MLLCIAHVIGWCIFVLRNDFNEGVGRHYSRFSPKIFQRGNMKLILQLVKEHN